jgi:maltose/moltooligosaccharide transporter
VTLSLGKTVFGAGPKDPAYDQAVGWTGLVNGSDNLVTAIAALFLVGMAHRFGAKQVHAAALMLAAVALVALAHVTNKYLVFVPMIGLGIAWASMLGVPYIMAVSMVPKERVGVYMGILNMMIVIPMLIETVTFGWIFNNLLGGQGTNAIMMAGVMLACGSVAMLWVTDPDAANDSPIKPLATHRAISVYNRVVVGSDGSPSSLHAVATAAGVANAADAHLVVVSAYNPQAGGGSAGSLRKELRGEEDARSVLRAAEGHRLGSVPTNVVRNASCDVLIVQSSKGAEKS